MDVRNCKKCGQIFNYVSGQQICPACRQALEDKFVEVKTYIRKNPMASIAQIEKECEVNSHQIRQWVREERLVFSSESSVGIECEMCGENIRTGRLCDMCRRKATRQLKGIYHDLEDEEKKKTKETKSKMHYMNRESRR